MTSQPTRHVQETMQDDAPAAFDAGTRDPAPRDRVALEQRISLLVHRANSRFGQIANKLLSRQGITMYHSRILLFLLQRREMRIGELVEAMALPQSTMSHQLKQLGARKLIRRRRSRSDNRAVAVMLTPAGEDIARACERYSTDVQRRLVEGFGPARIDLLTGLLRELFDALDVSKFSPETAAAPARPRARRIRRAGAETE